jgi:hypothetical protein
MSQTVSSAAKLKYLPKESLVMKLEILPANSLLLQATLALISA